MNRNEPVTSFYGEGDITLTVLWRGRECWQVNPSKYIGTIELFFQNMAEIILTIPKGEVLKEKKLSFKVDQEFFENKKEILKVTAEQLKSLKIAAFILEEEKGNEVVMNTKTGIKTHSTYFSRKKEKVKIETLPEIKSNCSYELHLESEQPYKLKAFITEKEESEFTNIELNESFESLQVTTSNSEQSKDIELFKSLTFFHLKPIVKEKAIAMSRDFLMNKRLYQGYEQSKMIKSNTGEEEISKRINEQLTKFVKQVNKKDVDNLSYEASSRGEILKVLPEQTLRLLFVTVLEKMIVEGGETVTAKRIASKFADEALEAFLKGAEKKPFIQSQNEQCVLN